MEENEDGFDFALADARSVRKESLKLALASGVTGGWLLQDVMSVAQTFETYINTGIVEFK